MELTEAVQAFLVERLLTWQVTLSASQSYFKELAEVERQRGKGYRRAAAMLAPKNIQRTDLLGSLSQLTGSLSGSSRSPSPVHHNNQHHNPQQPQTAQGSEPPDRGNTWLVPLQAAALKSDNETAGLLAYLEGPVLTRVAECKSFFKEHRDTIKARLEAACRDLSESRDRLAACNDAAVDPWLAQVQRSSRQQQYQRQQQQHQQSLHHLFTDISALDRELTGRLKAIIHEYFVVAGKTAAVFAEQMHDMSALMAAVDGPAEWSMAMLKAGIDENWRLTTNIQMSPRMAQLEKSVFDGIARSGFLMKQSGGFGRSWSVYFVVVSGTPTTNHIHGYRCASFPDDPNLRIPTASMHLHKRALTDLNEQMLSLLFADHSDWLGEPTFSLNLNSPSVTVRQEPPYLAITTTTAGGFFGKSEKKFLFKSWVDDDLTEWIGLVVSVASQRPPIGDIQGQILQQQQLERDLYVREQHIQEQYMQEQQLQEQQLQEQYMVRHSYGVPNADHRQYEAQDDLSESSSQATSNKNAQSSYSIVPPMDNPWND